MNRIAYGPNGGMPITQDHLNFQQSAVSEAIQGILLALADSTALGYIVRGCSVYADSGTNTLWVTEGYCVIQFGNLAELFYVPNHDLGLPTNTSTSALYWKLVETNVAPSPVTFKDLTVQNVHKQRRLTLATSSVNFYPLYTATPVFINHLAERLNGIGTVYQVGNANASSWLNGQTGALRYWKDKLNNVVLTGTITCTTNDRDVTTLPSGHRPPYIIYLSVLGKAGAGLGSIYHNIIQVSTNGTVSFVEDPEPGATYYLHIAGYKGN